MGLPTQRMRNGHGQTEFEKHPTPERVVRQEKRRAVLKGQQLGLRVNDELSDRQGRRILSGPAELEPASITVLAVPDEGRELQMNRSAVTRRATRSNCEGPYP